MTTRAASASNSVACLRGVRVTYDGFVSFALAGIGLEVHRGAILGLIGPKGSGKSTTLKLLAGELRPSDGTVKVFGGSPRRAAIRRRIGYLPQANSQSKAVGLRGLLQRWIVPRVQPLAGFPNHIRIARLLIKQPDLFLLDEPFANLDAAARNEIIGIMQKFADDGKTVVLAHETLAEAMDICHRLAIFFRGQIRAIGTLQELLALPDALHILAPVLPIEIVDKALRLIRAELPDASPENEGLALRLNDESKPVGPLQNTHNVDSPKDTVDHEKLNRLTKPVE